MGVASLSDQSHVVELDILSMDDMNGCGNPGRAASWEASEGLAVKTRPGSYSVRVLECADVGERKREGAGGW